MEHSNYYQTEAYQNKLGRLVFDRDKLEELTRKKIAEVNEETGYRVYFEVPEMVEIVAESIEEMLPDIVRGWLDQAEDTVDKLEELRDRHADILETLIEDGN